VAVGALLVVPWLIRGYVLSGYPFFPSEMGDLQLSWRIPAGVGRHELLYERAFARIRSTVDVETDYPWVAHWLALELLENREFLLPVGTLAVGAAAAAWLAFRGRRTPLARIAVIAFVALALWWWLAPDPRFAVPLLWTAASIAVLIAIELSSWSGQFEARAVKLMLAVAVVAGAFLSFSPSQVRFSQRFEALEPAKLVEGRFGSGEPVRVGRGCCNDLPCAEGDPSRIYLRRPGHLEAGFCTAPDCPPKPPR
jgi:hypothetical protein